MFFGCSCIWCQTFVFLVYSIIVMALFIPTIFIFYNETASIYVGMYGVISIVGNLLGSFVKKYFKITIE